MFKELNILKPFFEAPARRFNVREVARILGITPATASKKLKELAKMRILEYKKERILDLYKANLDSEEYRDLKLYYTIRLMKESGLVGALNKFYLKPSIVLFGSAASGTDTETSDIDIVIISEKTDRFPQEKDFERKLKRKLQMFAVSEIKDLKNPHLINNVLNGIVIQGEIKWI